jgi:hypothetical protein
VKRFALACLTACVGVLLCGRSAKAMPVFAEAYGYDCQKCHIQVPALNSYGRYVQRSMYAALDRKTLSSIPPVWLGEAAFSDTQDPNEPHKAQLGNLALHLSGFLSKDVTAHIQQWLVQNDQPGGLDTAWVSYDRIFGANTHVVVGKMPPPGPSAFSQWMDLAAFNVPQLTVGEHVQGFETNRWGAKAGYANENFAADIGWFGSSADLNGATDFSSGTDKTLQWNVTYAPVDRPIQFGLYGNTGAFPLSGGGIDRYSGGGLYAQLDQTARAPGALVMYQRGWDGNSGLGLGSAASNGTSFELFWRPLRHYEALLSAREQVSSDGLGGISHSGNVDVNFRVARFIHATLEQYYQTSGNPGLRYQLWWTSPLQREP